MADNSYISNSKMRSQLSRFILKCTILLVALILADRIVGTGLEYLYYQQKHGDDYTTLYALEKANDDVLIFGTSRASHHYNARVFTEDTEMSCFNAGRDEMEIPYTKALLSGIFSRYIPKMVILDIGPMELAGEKQVVYERVSAALMPLVNKYPMFESAVAQAGDMELLKMKASKIYPYNSKIGSAIQNSYTKLGHLSVHGYEPLYNTIDTTIYKESIWKDIDKNYPINSDYVATLENIINITENNDVELVICISPFYFYNDFTDNDSYNEIKKITAERNIPLLDFSNDPEFTGQPMLFYDDVHLNDTGATKYTHKVIQRMRAYGIL